MDCKTFQQLMADYLEPEDAGLIEDGAFRAHMESCKNCRKELEELLSVMEHAGKVTFKEPSEQYWDSFPGRVMTRIRGRRRQRMIRNLASLAAAAGVIVVVAIALIARAPQPDGLARLSAVEGLELNEVVTDEASTKELENLALLLNGDEPSFLELAQEAEDVTASLDAGLEGTDYGSEYSLYELLDMLELNEGETLIDQLTEELG
ncbi:hypothetical protein ACFLU6_08770 [Acidobacteriota bacterium]